MNFCFIKNKPICLVWMEAWSAMATMVSEENRRYLRGINFNGRYTLYNAPLELILGESKLLVVCFKKEKNVSQICNISM